VLCVRAGEVLLVYVSVWGRSQILGLVWGLVGSDSECLLNDDDDDERKCKSVFLGNQGSGWIYLYVALTP
jgi:hypothetical protein